ncbi:amidase [Suhomyces tanzawaensis NRRL Y-17324]|uniref:Amidase n=1 Tax=Suhomyces tanzawaensis NRRL Y-17324 TaxID=984487 RepID=A0A1E4SJ11_9ASCO|nr:amidase [Suhomyces tanzawaensis NRRL Y-17324]ODV79484.1 amidase [Suhomyces tanzawaensis NRRL Y-17324]
MTISYEAFLTKDPLDNYEDPAKFKQYATKLDKYRQDLEDALVPEYKVELPQPIDQLIEKQFNAVDYLYQNKLLTPKEFEITDQSAVSLAAKIADGVYTSVEVLKAYAKRAVIAHQFTNCAMQVFIDEGLERAQYLDDYLKTHGKTVGPFHGLPVSLKEHMDYRGKVTHASYVALIDNVTAKHGANTQILEDLGAVFYIRTTQPQAIMHLDSNNNYTGLTKNPYNLSLSSGGSSSGEGSLVTLGGSAFGVGSDIGGSIRSPAGFSGCYGLRPTSKRVCQYGAQGGGRGQEAVMPVAGPMTRSIEDIEFFMKHFINDGKPWDHDFNSIRIPWKDVPQPSIKDLTIAVMYDDGLVKPTPPILRGLKDTVAKLEKAGAKIVEFKPIKTKEAYEVVHKMYTADGNSVQRGKLAASGEPLKKLTKWFLNYGDGAKDITVSDYKELNAARDDLRHEYNKYFIDNKVDLILSPVYNNVAPKPEEVYNWSYTSLYNITDLPSIAIQTGLFQDPAIDKWDADHANYKFRSDLEKLELDNYKPEEFVGAPISVQLATRRYHDEELVAGTKAVLEVLGTDLYKH